MCRNRATSCGAQQRPTGQANRVDRDLRKGAGQKTLALLAGLRVPDISGCR